ncbi:MAG: bacterial Ig-like domain-containing protein [Christensenellaceae bacterium]|jgi:hypothetical protein|nr:bacterial Ig-like domain-containing protein [Christensenellaceae bacterium]
MRKKLFLLILIAVTAILGGLSLAACKTDKSAVKEYYAIGEFPNTDYYLGQTINLNGAFIVVTHNDGSTSTLPITADMVTFNGNAGVPGLKDVVITYEDFSTTVKVNYEDRIVSGVTLKLVEPERPLGLSDDLWFDYLGAPKADIFSLLSNTLYSDFSAILSGEGQENTILTIDIDEVSKKETYISLESHSTEIPLIIDMKSIVAVRTDGSEENVIKDINEIINSEGEPDIEIEYYPQDTAFKIEGGTLYALIGEEYPVGTGNFNVAYIKAKAKVSPKYAQDHANERPYRQNPLYAGYNDCRITFNGQKVETTLEYDSKIAYEVTELSLRQGSAARQKSVFVFEIMTGGSIKADSQYSYIRADASTSLAAKESTVSLVYSAEISFVGGGTAKIPVQATMLAGYDKNKAGEYQGSLVYDVFTDEVLIKVHDNTDVGADGKKAMYLDTAPYKSVYYVGEAFNPAGLKIRIEYKEHVVAEQEDYFRTVFSAVHSYNEESGLFRFTGTNLSGVRTSHRIGIAFNAENIENSNSTLAVRVDAAPANTMDFVYAIDTNAVNFLKTSTGRPLTYANYSPSEDLWYDGDAYTLYQLSIEANKLNPQYPILERPESLKSKNGTEIRGLSGVIYLWLSGAQYYVEAASVYPLVDDNQNLIIPLYNAEGAITNPVYDASRAVWLDNTAPLKYDGNNTPLPRSPILGKNGLPLTGRTAITCIDGNPQTYGVIKTNEVYLKDEIDKVISREYGEFIRSAVYLLGGDTSKLNDYCWVDPVNGVPVLDYQGNKIYTPNGLQYVFIDGVRCLVTTASLERSRIYDDEGISVDAAIYSRNNDCWYDAFLPTVRRTPLRFGNGGIITGADALVTGGVYTDKVTTFTVGDTLNMNTGSAVITFADNGKSVIPLSDARISLTDINGDALNGRAAFDNQVVGSATLSLKFGNAEWIKTIGISINDRIPDRLIFSDDDLTREEALLRRPGQTLTLDMLSYNVRFNNGQFLVYGETRFTPAAESAYLPLTAEMLSDNSTLFVLEPTSEQITADKNENHNIHYQRITFIYRDRNGNETYNYIDIRAKADSQREAATITVDAPKTTFYEGGTLSVSDLTSEVGIPTYLAEGYAVVAYDTGEESGRISLTNTDLISVVYYRDGGVMGTDLVFEYGANYTYTARVYYKTLGVMGDAYGEYTITILNTAPETVFIQKEAAGEWIDASNSSNFVYVFDNPEQISFKAKFSSGAIVTLTANDVFNSELDFGGEYREVSFKRENAMLTVRIRLGVRNIGRLAIGKLPNIIYGQYTSFDLSLAGLELYAYYNNNSSPTKHTQFNSADWEIKAYLKDSGERVNLNNPLDPKYITRTIGTKRIDVSYYTGAGRVSVSYYIYVVSGSGVVTNIQYLGSQSGSGASITYDASVTPGTKVVRTDSAVIDLSDAIHMDELNLYKAEEISVEGLYVRITTVNGQNTAFTVIPLSRAMVTFDPNSLAFSMYKEDGSNADENYHYLLDYNLPVTINSHTDTVLPLKFNTTTRILTSIAVVTLPYITDYIEGQPVNLSGGIIRRYFDDLSSDLVSMDQGSVSVVNYTIYPFAGLSTGIVQIASPVTVQLQGKTTVYNVTVHRKMTLNMIVNGTVIFYTTPYLISQQLPVVTPVQIKPYFDLPEYRLYFRNSEGNIVLMTPTVGGYPTLPGIYDLFIETEGNDFYVEKKGEGNLIPKGSFVILAKPIDIIINDITVQYGDSPRSYQFTYSIAGAADMTGIGGEAAQILIGNDTVNIRLYVVNENGIEIATQEFKTLSAGNYSIVAVEIPSTGQNINQNHRYIFGGISVNDTSGVYTVSKKLMPQNAITITYASEFAGTGATIAAAKAQYIVAGSAFAIASSDIIYQRIEVCLNPDDADFSVVTVVANEPVTTYYRVVSQSSSPPAAYGQYRVLVNPRNYGLQLPGGVIGDAYKLFIIS